MKAIYYYVLPTNPFINNYDILDSNTKILDR